MPKSLLVGDATSPFFSLILHFFCSRTQPALNSCLKAADIGTQTQRLQLNQFVADGSKLVLV
jgi:hypothetical protein